MNEITETAEELLRILPKVLDSALEPVTWSEMVIDSRVQRILDRVRVENMALDWNPNAAGTPTISRRLDGALILLDGQHRRAAAMAIGSGREQVSCKVFRGLTIEQEAALFKLLNNTKQPSAIDLHRVAVVAGDARAMEIDKVVRGVGLEVKTGGAHALRAIRSVYKIHDASPEAAHRTLLILVGAFGGPTDRGGIAVDSRLVEGLGLVMRAHGDLVDIERMSMKLAKQSGGAGGLIAAGRALANIRRFTVAHAVADIAIETYNVNRRNNILSKLK